MRISDIIEATGGELKGGSPGTEFGRISIDSRSIRPGEVFFALRGKNFDGHDFIPVAASAASGVVAERKVSSAPSGLSLVIVGDTVKALGDVASHIRKKRRSVPLVAVSGSSGKTTTKEMIASILKTSGRVLKTEGNRNNLIGLPLTLAGLDGGCDAAVVELGVSVPGEMERLVEISDPDVAVVTNVGSAHLEGFQSVEGVAREKAVLLLAPGPGCARVVNLDDPRLSGVARRAGSRTVTFSVREDADVRAVSCRDLGEDGVEAEISVRGEKACLRLSRPGAFNLSNALAAIASVIPLGTATIPGIEEGISLWTPLKGRMEVLKFSGLTVIDDTYNANPESVVAALKTLAGMKGRKVSVLGEMLELGPGARSFHREAGRTAQDCGVDLLVCIGALAGEIAEGAVEAGLSPKKVLFFNDKKEALAGLKGMLGEGDIVLVKGSRGGRLEEVVEGLRQEAPMKKALC